MIDMKRQFASGLFPCMLGGAIVWVMVGAPAAALIAACRVFAWVIFAVPQMAITAAVLGLLQGLWLHLSSDWEESRPRKHAWLGSLSGAILGLLGFAPVFSRINIVADRGMVAVFLSAATVGGILSGVVLTRVGFLKRPYWTPRLGRSVLVGFLLIVPLVIAELRLYGAAVADRLPVSPVSEQDVNTLGVGDARDSRWAGCYEYLGQFSRSSGVVGSEGGLMKVAQDGGSLQIRTGEAYVLRGELRRNGAFRVGTQYANGQETTRVIWQGRFDGNSLQFTRRWTVVHHNGIENTTKLAGTAWRVSCD